MAAPAAPLHRPPHVLLVLQPQDRVLHQARVGLVGVVPDLVQRDQLVGEAPVGRLRLGQVQAVLLLEVERVVDVRPVRGELVVVQVQVAGHGVDGGEGGVGRALRDARLVRVGEVGGVRGARGRRGVAALAQLLPDYHQVLVLLEDLPRNVRRVVVHVLRAVRTHLRPVRMVQRAVVQAWNATCETGPCKKSIVQDR